MTQEEKAKAYDEALERAKNLQKDAIDMEEYIRAKQCEIIFPELKSEDERVRKWLLGFVQGLPDEGLDFHFYNLNKEQVIAWLEKQKVTDEEIIFRPVVGTDIRIAAKQALEKIEIGKKVVLAFNGAYIPVNGKTVGEIDSEYDAWLEKQKDTNVLIQEASEKAYTEGMRVERKHWLEKQEEQSDSDVKDYTNIDPHFGKPADKVEAKFHEGDWIIHHGTENIYQVVAIIDNQYQLKYGDNYTIQNCADVDRCARLYDIVKDAKDGDVLYHSDTASNGIFIFKELLEYGFGKKVICYCDYDSEDGFCLGESHTCCWTDAKILHPATKEQRDTLFKAMADAGYTFDFEKKELKKVETYES